MIIINKGIDWIYLINEKSLNKNISGKYLFFSDNKTELIKLGEVLLEKFDLFQAKVPLSDTPNNSKGFGFVLCVYDKDGTNFRIKKYKTETISYRGFKSNEKTRQGIYSKQYLESKLNN
jgi:hypothetical protein